MLWLSRSRNPDPIYPQETHEAQREIESVLGQRDSMPINELLQQLMPQLGHVAVKDPHAPDLLAQGKVWSALTLPRSPFGLAFTHPASTDDLVLYRGRWYMRSPEGDMRLTGDRWPDWPTRESYRRTTIALRLLAIRHGIKPGFPMRGPS